MYSTTAKIVAMCQDPEDAVTRLAEAYEVLRLKEERYHAVFSATPDAIAICRMDDGMFVDVNPQFFEMLGYRREELIAQTSVESCTWIDLDGTAHSGQFIDVAGRSTCELNIWNDNAAWERLK